MKVVCGYIFKVQFDFNNVYVIFWYCMILFEVGYS